MPTAAQYFVFVRYWPGFTDNVPYGAINALDDESVEQELLSSLHIQLPKYARQHKEERARMRGLAEDLCNQMIEVVPTTAQTIAEMGRLCNWFSDSSPTATTQYIFSRRVWIANVASEAEALSLTDDLSRYPQPPDVLDDECFSFRNPKFGYVCSDGLEELSAVKAEIVRVSSRDLLDNPIEEHVQEFLTLVNKLRTAVPIKFDWVSQQDLADLLRVSIGHFKKTMGDLRERFQTRTGKRNKTLVSYCEILPSLRDKWPDAWLPTDRQGAEPLIESRRQERAAQEPHRKAIRK